MTIQLYVPSSLRAFLQFLLSKASAPYWNSGSATTASSAGFIASTLPILPISRSAISVWYFFTSAASCSVFSMAQLTEEQHILFSRWDSLTKEQKSYCLTLWRQYESPSIYKNIASEISFFSVS